MQRALIVLMLAATAAGCRNSGGGVPGDNISAGQAAANEPFFVGRWAAAETACGHAAWEFTASGLATPGEVSCTFNDVMKTPAGYDIAATCTAEGPPESHRISLSYAESADALLVEGGPFNPVGLVACRP
jgi:hypothetical protein